MTSEGDDSGESTTFHTLHTDVSDANDLDVEQDTVDTGANFKSFPSLSAAATPNVQAGNADDVTLHSYPLSVSRSKSHGDFRRDENNYQGSTGRDVRDAAAISRSGSIHFLEVPGRQPQKAAAAADTSKQTPPAAQSRISTFSQNILEQQQQQQQQRKTTRSMHSLRNARSLTDTIYSGSETPSPSPSQSLSRPHQNLPAKPEYLTTRVAKVTADRAQERQIEEADDEIADLMPEMLPPRRSTRSPSVIAAAGAFGRRRSTLSHKNLAKTRRDSENERKEKSKQPPPPISYFKPKQRHSTSYYRRRCKQRCRHIILQQPQTLMTDTDVDRLSQVQRQPNQKYVKEAMTPGDLRVSEHVSILHHEETHKLKKPKKTTGDKRARLRYWAPPIFGAIDPVAKSLYLHGIRCIGVGLLLLLLSITSIFLGYLEVFEPYLYYVGGAKGGIGLILLVVGARLKQKSGIADCEQPAELARTEEPDDVTREPTVQIVEGEMKLAARIRRKLTMRKRSKAESESAVQQPTSRNEQRVSVLPQSLIDDVNRGIVDPRLNVDLTTYHF